MPSLVGYTIFRADGLSPSFPRQINLNEPGRPAAVLAIEYAIWWDWDIQHLYELEHAWVFIDAGGQVVRGEASWHGGYHDMAVAGRLTLNGDRLILFSEPGKHAFAPNPDWLHERADRTRDACTRYAGRGGVLVTPLFEDNQDIAIAKTPLADRLAHTYLERHTFEPSMDFSQVYPLAADLLVPWPPLSAWIPQRVAWWTAELERTIPPGERRILRIGHRGASGHVAENTLAAIRKAAELQADLVELDVQTSADGVPIIIHDTDVDRISRSPNRAGPVSSYTLSQLKALDAGGGEQIPTLAEAIACCREHRLGIYLELKSGSAIAPVIAAIQAEDLYHGLIVASFRPDWVAHAKQLDPKISTSILFSATNIDPVKLAQSVQADYVHPCWERAAPKPHQLLTPDWIAQVRAAKLGLICWHEERPTEIAALKQLGVDGICSDLPELLLL